MEDNNSNIAKQLGKRGGQKTFKTHGVDHYKRMKQIAIKNKELRKKLLSEI